MKRLLILLALALTLVGCGTAATQPTQTTQTAEPQSSSGIVDKSGAQPGLYFTHPAGWQLLEADERGLMVYSAEGAGDRLFNTGLKAGEVVVQVSATPRSRVESDIANYVISLIETTNTPHEDPTPITINGFEGYQVSGQREQFVITITVTEQYGELVEVIAYTSPDDADAQQSVIDSILKSALWKLPTE